MSYSIIFAMIFVITIGATAHRRKKRKNSRKNVFLTAIQKSEMISQTTYEMWNLLNFLSTNENVPLGPINLTQYRNKRSLA